MAWLAGALRWMGSRMVMALLGLLAICGVAIAVMKRQIDRQDERLRKATGYIDTTHRIANTDLAKDNDEAIDYLKRRQARDEE